MGKAKVPKAPDPFKVSEAQTASNKDTAAFNASLNRIDQSSPFGSVNFSQNGTDPTTGAPIFSQQTTLSPELQGLLNSQIGSQQGISNAITNQIGNLPTGNFNPNIDVGDIRQRSFDSQMALLKPEFDQSRKELEGRLSDRGIPLGSEISNDLTGNFDRARDTSILAASRQADLDGSNEFQRQFGNQLTEFNQPFNTLGQLMGNSQAVSNPSFSPFASSSAQGTDVAGNIFNSFQADTARANQQNSQFANGLLGLGQLGLAAFSDIRLKRDIRRIGSMPSGLPVYSYKYVWSDAPQIGVMAQEAMGMFPDAVSVHDSGFLVVNYGRIA